MKFFEVLKKSYFTREPNFSTKLKMFSKLFNTMYFSCLILSYVKPAWSESPGIVLAGLVEKFEE